MAEIKMKEDIFSLEKKNLKGWEIIGIKKTPSKDKSRVYTSYMCKRPWTDYEFENSDVEGFAVEEIQTTEDFPLVIGDTVIFYYGKAIGKWQPVTDYKMVSPATPFDKDKQVKESVQASK